MKNEANKNHEWLVKITEQLNWIPKKLAMNYLGYGETMFRELCAKGDLVYSKVGNRIFVRVDSLKRLIDKNVQ
jgi:hypothetical protein